MKLQHTHQHQQNHLAPSATMIWRAHPLKGGCRSLELEVMLALIVSVVCQILFVPFGRPSFQSKPAFKGTLGGTK